MSDQHALQPDADIPRDEDNSVLEAVEGIPGREAKPDPDSFMPRVEADDPENDA
jgi:hypothetical protein